MRKWNLPLTYKPKIEAVRNHECTQTIRKKGKIPKQVGDLVSFHGYENGRGTPWTWRTPYWELVEVLPMRVHRELVCFPLSDGGFDYTNWKCLDSLAACDFISPPTGEALRDVLVGMNGKIPVEGIECQILRWM